MRQIKWPTGCHLEEILCQLSSVSSLHPRTNYLQHTLYTKPLDMSSQFSSSRCLADNIISLTLTRYKNIEQGSWFDIKVARVLKRKLLPLQWVCAMNNGTTMLVCCSLPLTLSMDKLVAVNSLVVINAKHYRIGIFFYCKQYSFSRKVRFLKYIILFASFFI